MFTLFTLVSILLAVSIHSHLSLLCVLPEEGVSSSAEPGARSAWGNHGHFLGIDNWHSSQGPSGALVTNDCLCRALKQTNKQTNQHFRCGMRKRAASLDQRNTPLNANRMDSRYHYQVAYANPRQVPS